METVKAFILKVTFFIERIGCSCDWPLQLFNQTNGLLFIRSSIEEFFYFVPSSSYLRLKSQFRSIILPYAIDSVAAECENVEQHLLR